MATPPVFISPTDPTEIFAELKTEYETRVGKTLYPAQVEYQLLQTMAYRESLLRLGIQNAGEMNLVDFSRAPFLDFNAVLVGVYRLAAQPATVTIRFQLTTGHTGVTIPALTRVSSTDNKTVWEVTESKSAATGITYIDVLCSCQVPGVVGNGYLIGSISKIMDPVTNVDSAANTTVSGGGTDQEDDDALRERIKLAPEAFTTAGPYGAYEFHARTASPGIIDVSVTRPTPGTVSIYPLMEDGSVTSVTVLDAVYAACNDRKVRPLTDTVLTDAPTIVPYDLEVDLVLITDADAVGIQTLVEDALAAYALERRQKLGRNIVGTQVIGKCHAASPDIYDVTLVGFSDITVDETEFALVGTITVNITGYSNE